jgi:hypothetical protein
MFLVALSIACAARRAAAEVDPADTFRTDITAEAKSLTEQKIAAFAGVDGWLFLTAELRFISTGQFWSDGTSKINLPTNPGAPDAFAAIVDFNRQLRGLGVHLLLAPVPPKADIYPEKLFSSFQGPPDALWSDLQRFYRALASAGVDVIDLLPLFYANRADERGSLYCRTDSHWSDIGCIVAAKAIADHVRSFFQTNNAQADYLTSWNEITFAGDLVSLLPTNSAKPDPEKLKIRQVRAPGGNGAIQPDSESPLLLIGDSHTLVFHDFLAAEAGLLDQLTLELGIRPDLIGTRGSGATAVRVSLYRRGLKDAGYVARKKIVVWCFSTREFTEASPGWQLLPVSK